MKQTILFFVLIIFSQLSIGQTVSSSCTAEEDIIEKYQTDAKRLTLRNIYHYDLTYVDSIEIPQTYSDTVLHALLAVYNATDLPARDTVVSMYNIHTFPYPSMNTFEVSADLKLDAEL